MYCVGIVMYRPDWFNIAEIKLVEVVAVEPALCLPRLRLRFRTQCVRAQATANSYYSLLSNASYRLTQSAIERDWARRLGAMAACSIFPMMISRG